MPISTTEPNQESVQQTTESIINASIFGADTETKTDDDETSIRKNDEADFPTLYVAVIFGK